MSKKGQRLYAALYRLQKKTGTFLAAGILGGASVAVRLDRRRREFSGWYGDVLDFLFVHGLEKKRRGGGKVK